MAPAERMRAGGSIRVYAVRRGKHPVRESVAAIRRSESDALNLAALSDSRRHATEAKPDSLSLVHSIRRSAPRVHGVGASARVRVLIHQCSLDERIVAGVAESAGFPKIGRYMPGTPIPAPDVSTLLHHQPEHAPLLLWDSPHPLLQRFRNRGFTGKFIVPPPHPKIIDQQATLSFWRRVTAQIQRTNSVLPI